MKTTITRDRMQNTTRIEIEVSDREMRAAGEHDDAVRAALRRGVESESIAYQLRILARIAAALPVLRMTGKI